MILMPNHHTISLPSGEYLIVRVPPKIQYLKIGDNGHSISFAVPPYASAVHWYLIDLPPGHTYTLIGLGSEITEETAREIVECAADNFGYKDYEGKQASYFYSDQSIHSLIRSFGEQPERVVLLKINKECMKKYQVIYADPPWSYKNKRTGGNMISGADAKYKTMSLDEICNLNVPSDKNAVLYLWATVPLMKEAFTVMEAWGFTYKTMLTWRKVMSLGMGYWYRGQCEHVLFGVKGNIKAFRFQEPNFIQTKVGKHSEKPDEFRKLIERSTPHLPHKLELFARQHHEGWDVFGNEVENSITLTPKP